MSVVKHDETVQVHVPKGTSARTVQELIDQTLASRSAVERIAVALSETAGEVGPHTAAQLASVEQLWRHLVRRYDVYRSTDIARMRGASATNRSVATNLAKREGLLGVVRGSAKLYPRYQFKGVGAHPSWKAVSEPLIRAGWDAEDVLLWMVAPHAGLDGEEPASLIDSPRVADVIRVVEREAQGVW